MIRSIAATYSQRILGTVLGIMTTVIIARTLGPEGRGVVAAVGTLAALGAQVANLGFQSANTYFVAQDKSSATAARTRSLVIGFGVGVPVAAALLALSAADVILPSINWWLTGLGLVSIPFAVSASLFVGMLVGLGKISSFNLSELLQKSLPFLAVVALATAGAASAESVLVAGTLAQCVTFAILLLLLREVPWKTPDRQDSPLKPQLAYGLRAFLASLLAFLLLRINLLMVQQMAGNAAAGHYSVAMAFFDGIYLLPATIGVLLFPKLSAMPDARQRWLETTKMMRVGLGLLILSAGAIAALAQPLVTLIFGAEFSDAVPLLRVLMLAVVLYGMNGVLSVFLAACGMPWIAVWVWTPALLLNVALNLAWIPLFGALGAAWASVAGCLVIFAVQFVYGRRHAA